MKARRRKGAKRAKSKRKKERQGGCRGAPNESRQAPRNAREHCHETICAASGRKAKEDWLPKTPAAKAGGRESTHGRKFFVNGAN